MDVRPKHYLVFRNVASAMLTAMDKSGKLE